jgi:hypothetical protein
MITATDTYTFIDCAGVQYYVKDVPGAGDCALLALLLNPDFKSPCTSPDELRRLVISYVRGPSRNACSRMFTIVGDRTNFTFELYLKSALRPRFWVGTIFYLWASVALGVNIHSHFFNEFREPKMDCTGTFLRNYFPMISQDGWIEVNVYFHQYGSMSRCKPSMYNHFAALLHMDSTSSSSELPCLNETVNQNGQPWWKKTEEVHGYDCSLKQPKPKKQKKSMNKEERKEYTKALTYHYLKQQEDGAEVTEMMNERLKKCSTTMHDNDDVEVTPKPDVALQPETIAGVRSYLSKHEHRTWLQRAHIIFLYLHPCIGKKMQRLLRK